jgi:hypothetical protein
MGSNSTDAGQNSQGKTGRKRKTSKFLQQHTFRGFRFCDSCVSLRNNIFYNDGNIRIFQWI